MDTLYENPILENIMSLCQNSSPKVSFSKMCDDLGLSRSLNTKLSKDPERKISGSTALKISDYFGVSVDRVLGSDKKETSPAPKGEGLAYEDMELLSAYRNADPMIKESIQRILKLK